MAGWLEPVKGAGIVVLSTVQLLASLLYTLSTPLRWPVYYLFKTIAFLLSPLWVILKFGLGTASVFVGLMAKFKYLYTFVACAAIIGLCAGFLLHSTSSFFFVLLGLNTAERRQKLVDQYYEEGVKRSRLSLGSGSTSTYDDTLESPSFSSDSWKKSLGGKSWPRSGKQRASDSIDFNDVYGRRRKLVRTAELQSRGGQRIGFMAPTIHEESSESDSFLSYVLKDNQLPDRAETQATGRLALIQMLYNVYHAVISFVNDFNGLPEEPAVPRRLPLALRARNVAINSAGK
ncbi:hypothetical protein F5Y17DRAFT_454214 [Xylariaceae sp. FL0594]|nr:hypothetical protein F5Y17DRAFT_454214 [Xylariaceae sp. FL0594]